MKNYKRIYIEVTNTCNLSCDFCPKTKRRLKFMDSDTFLHILQEIRPYTDHIYYHVLGEPLLHPELGKFLALSGEYGFKVNITTNGTLIDSKAEALLTSPALRQVNFSLHSFDANEKTGTMEEYINKILDFIDKARTSSNIICSLRLWNLEEERSSAYSGINEEDTLRNNHLLAILEERLNLDYLIKERFKETSRLKLANNLYLNAANRFEWPDVSAEQSDVKGFCHGLRDQIAILVDGTVVPCCLDGEGVINLGNILASPFEEIIRGERARKLYEGFSNRKVVEELCRKCDYRRRFSK